MMLRRECFRFSGEENRKADVLVKMMGAGLGVARVDASSYKGVERLDVVDDIRKAVDKYSKDIGRVYPLAVALDIGCGSIRTGKITEVNLIFF